MSTDPGTAEQQPHPDLIPVKVIYTGPVERLVGQGQEEIRLAKGSTLRDLLQLLTRRHGLDFRDYVFIDGETVSQEILILVDGINALTLKGLETPLVADSGTEVEVGFLGPIPVGG